MSQLAPGLQSRADWEDASRLACKREESMKVEGLDLLERMAVTSNRLTASPQHGRRLPLSTGRHYFFKRDAPRRVCSFFFVHPAPIFSSPAFRDRVICGGAPRFYPWHSPLSVRSSFCPSVG